ncbi:hypothetical protein FLLO111716_12540 [Flavobacterium longum]|uniref:amidohydrolase n=1 Tax=Flavobacterium longum TaxID=1299340 RepID=UPI0039EA173F
MRISLLQSTLVWEDIPANLAAFEQRISALPDTDLIVLPEMFSTGFTMRPNRVAEPMDGQTVNWMKAMAAKTGAALCGSAVIEVDGKYFNRCLFVHPTGEVVHYDKRHLFTLAGEDEAFTAGREKLIVTYKDFRICPLVCYDLRFPVFSRNVEAYDLLIYVANWPEPRVSAWDALLKARAIENMSFAVGVNRVGKDGNGQCYVGHSQVFDMLGNPMGNSSEDEAIINVSLDKGALLEARQKFGFLNDRDTFTVV